MTEHTFDQESFDTLVGEHGHQFYRTRFTGNTICANCSLMPIDPSDLTLPCETTDEEK